MVQTIDGCITVIVLVVKSMTWTTVPDTDIAVWVDELAITIDGWVALGMTGTVTIDGSVALSIT